MTNEEAIKVLNTIDNCLKGNGYDWEHEGIKTAIQALEKQIPKTPMCRHYGPYEIDKDLECMGFEDSEVDENG